MLGLVGTQIFMNAIAFGLDAQLVHLHRWLQAREIGTYDLVIYQRKEIEKKKDLKEGIIDKAEFDRWCDTYFTVK